MSEVPLYLLVPGVACLCTGVIINLYQRVVCWRLISSGAPYQLTARLPPGPDGARDLYQVITCLYQRVVCLHRL